MKTLKLKTIVSLIILLIGVHVGSRVGAEEGKKSFWSHFDPYVEIAPTFFLPLDQSHGDKLFGAPDDKIGFGGGAHLGLGVDTKWLGLGTKIRGEAIKVDSFYIPNDGTAMLYSWDILEARLFVVDWFRKEPGKLRPYLLAGAGYNIGSYGGWGAQANIGAGAQYQITKRFYLGGEATYRAVGTVFSNDASNIALAMTLGWRF